MARSPKAQTITGTIVETTFGSSGQGTMRVSTGSQVIDFWPVFESDVPADHGDRVRVTYREIRYVLNERTLRTERILDEATAVK